MQANVSNISTTAATKGQVNLQGTNGGGMQIVAKTAGQSAGNVAIIYNTAAGNAANGAVYNNGVMTVTLKTSAWADATSAGAVGTGNTGTVALTANVAGTQFAGEP